jgi:gamma-glutamylcyclotransferase (GGCT)/AIG2-like uncharacterized protein YtfP
MSRLFVYGTLIAPGVFREVVGRELPARSAKLRGYARYRLKGLSYPGLVPEAGATTSGLLYEGLEAVALRRLDRFEGELYVRRRVQVDLDADASAAGFVYVIKREHRAVLSDEPWDADVFCAHGVERFLVAVRAGELR